MTTIIFDKPRPPVWSAIAEACGEPFADSYVGAAVETAASLVVKSRTAFERLKANRPAMDVLAKRGLKLVGPDPRYIAWSPPSDEEYAQMSLSEKIDHHTVMASQAAFNAGPMWAGTGKNGRRVTVDQMEPHKAENWRFWNARRESHMAEAKLLRERLFKAKHA